MNTNHEIAKIAYELYLSRGGKAGDPVADWLTAERIFAERQQATVITEDTTAKSFELRTEGLVVVETRAKSVKTGTAARPKATPKAAGVSERAASAKTVAPRVITKKAAAEPKPASEATRAKKPKKS